MEIITPRLLLRDFTPHDAQAVHAFDADPELTRYRGGGQITEEDTRAFIQRTQQWLQSEPRPIYALAVMIKEQDKMVGVVGLTITERDAGQAELWYRLSRTFGRQGYTTEASSAMLAFGFTELRLHRIAALCHPDNVGSRRVMEKIGMQYEGRLRENFLNSDGTWRDSLLYAILDHEWQAKSAASHSVKLCRWERRAIRRS
jgi:RimJ/RimL family protein N-acetyltransferase